MTSPRAQNILIIFFIGLLNDYTKQSSFINKSEIIPKGYVYRNQKKEIRERCYPFNHWVLDSY